MGFIAFFGIALQNGMVLVQHLNQLLRDGVPMAQACVKGACERLRPVLMTALTTLLGLPSSTGADGAAGRRTPLPFGCRAHCRMEHK